VEKNTNIAMVHIDFSSNRHALDRSWNNKATIEGKSKKKKRRRKKKKKRT
jgi:hypothetical protein